MKDDCSVVEACTSRHAEEGYPRLLRFQVIEHKLTAAEKDTIKQELEATVGLQMDHPNVVHTFKHVTRLMSPVSPLSKEPPGLGSRRHTCAGEHE